MSSAKDNEDKTWHAAIDPASGDTYYYNAAGETSWDRPEGYVSDAEPARPTLDQFDGYSDFETGGDVVDDDEFDEPAESSSVDPTAPLLDDIDAAPPVAASAVVASEFDESSNVPETAQESADDQCLGNNQDVDGGEDMGDLDDYDGDFDFDDLQPDQPAEPDSSPPVRDDDGGDVVDSGEPVIKVEEAVGITNEYAADEFDQVELPEDRKEAAISEQPEAAVNKPLRSEVALQDGYGDDDFDFHSDNSEQSEKKSPAQHNLKVHDGNGPVASVPPASPGWDDDAPGDDVHDDFDLGEDEGFDAPVFDYSKEQKDAPEAFGSNSPEASQPVDSPEKSNVAQPSSKEVDEPQPIPMEQFVDGFDGNDPNAQAYQDDDFNMNDSEHEGDSRPVARGDNDVPDVDIEEEIAAAGPASPHEASASESGHELEIDPQDESVDEDFDDQKDSAEAAQDPSSSSTLEVENGQLSEASDVDQNDYQQSGSEPPSGAEGEGRLVEADQSFSESDYEGSSPPRIEKPRRRPIPMFNRPEFQSTVRHFRVSALNNIYGKALQKDFQKLNRTRPASAKTTRSFHMIGRRDRLPISRKKAQALRRQRQQRPWVPVSLHDVRPGFRRAGVVERETLSESIYRKQQRHWRLRGRRAASSSVRSHSRAESRSSSPGKDSRRRIQSARGMRSGDVSHGGGLNASRREEETLRLEYSEGGGDESMLEPSRPSHAPPADDGFSGRQSRTSRRNSRASASGSASASEHTRLPSYLSSRIAMLEANERKRRVFEVKKRYANMYRVVADKSATASSAPNFSPRRQRNQTHTKSEDDNAQHDALEQYSDDFGEEASQDELKSKQRLDPVRARPTSARSRIRSASSLGRSRFDEDKPHFQPDGGLVSDEEDGRKRYRPAGWRPPSQTVPSHVVGGRPSAWEAFPLYSAIDPPPGLGKEPARSSTGLDYPRPWRLSRAELRKERKLRHKTRKSRKGPNKSPRKGKGKGKKSKARKREKKGNKKGDKNQAAKSLVSASSAAGAKEPVLTEAESAATARQLGFSEMLNGDEKLVDDEEEEKASGKAEFDDQPQEGHELDSDLPLSNDDEQMASGPKRVEIPRVQISDAIAEGNPAASESPATNADGGDGQAGEDDAAAASGTNAGGSWTFSLVDEKGSATPPMSPLSKAGAALLGNGAPDPLALDSRPTSHASAAPNSDIHSEAESTSVKQDVPSSDVGDVENDDKLSVPVSPTSFAQMDKASRRLSLERELQADIQSHLRTLSPSEAKSSPDEAASFQQPPEDAQFLDHDDTAFRKSKSQNQKLSLDLDDMDLDDLELDHADLLSPTSPTASSAIPVVQAPTDDPQAEQSPEDEEEDEYAGMTKKQKYQAVMAKRRAEKAAAAAAAATANAPSSSTVNQDLATNLETPTSETPKEAESDLAQTEQELAEQAAEEERARKQRELAEQAAAEEQERVRKQRELAEQAAAEERARKQKELAEQAAAEERARKQRELAEQAAAEEQERLRKQRELAEQAAAEERARKQRELAEQAAAEEKERLRRQKELAEQVAAEEEARRARETVEEAAAAEEKQTSLLSEKKEPASDHDDHLFGDDSVDIYQDDFDHVLDDDNAAAGLGAASNLEGNDDDDPLGLNFDVDPGLHAPSGHAHAHHEHHHDDAAGDSELSEEDEFDPPTEGQWKEVYDAGSMDFYYYRLDGPERITTWDRPIGSATVQPAPERAQGIRGASEEDEAASAAVTGNPMGSAQAGLQEYAGAELEEGEFDFDDISIDSQDLM